MTTRLTKHLLSLTLISLLFACSDDQSNNNNTVETQPIEVETLQLLAQPWSYNIESFGQLSVAETVIIGVESSGIIRQLNLLEVQKVKAGELLFSLDSKKQQLRFEQSAASVKEAESQAQQSRKTFDRFQALRAVGSTSEDQLQQAKTNFDAAVARLQQAEAALDIANTELAERQIYSPVDGVIEAEEMEVGQHVQPGQQLAIIQADGALQVITHVNEREVLQLNLGQSAEGVTLI